MVAIMDVRYPREYPIVRPKISKSFKIKTETDVIRISKTLKKRTRWYLYFMFRIATPILSKSISGNMSTKGSIQLYFIEMNRPIITNIIFIIDKK